MAKIDVPRIAPSEITPETVWRARRLWLQGVGAGAFALGGGALPNLASAAASNSALSATANPQYWLSEKPTPEKDVTGYNNFYEFGTGKTDPRDRSKRFQSRPWTVMVDGEVAKPQNFDIDDLLKLAPMEERIYRLRCVEAWSMVIPWIGYSLSNILDRVEPTSKAKFVEFTTVAQEESMPGLKSRILDWPYVEGLRIDEAMHPLTMMVFGVYGKMLPSQNGAPLRVAIPWKYGFKSGKSIVRIRLLETRPQTSWVRVAPNEYGFYANVNPKVDHPRWSQATERKIGGGFLAPKSDTLMFNGYEEQVAALYRGMDLSRDY